MGFPNGANLCYRNAAFQVLLHSPVVLNWVNWYKKHHAPTNACQRGAFGAPCKLCLLHDLSTAYWAGNKKAAINALKTLSAAIFWTWKGESEQEGDTQEDAPEYFEQMIEQFKKEIIPMM